MSSKAHRAVMRRKYGDNWWRKGDTHPEGLYPEHLRQEPPPEGVPSKAEKKAFRDSMRQKHGDDWKKKASKGDARAMREAVAREGVGPGTWHDISGWPEVGRLEPSVPYWATYDDLFIEYGDRADHTKYLAVEVRRRGPDTYDLRSSGIEDEGFKGVRLKGLTKAEAVKTIGAVAKRHRKRRQKFAKEMFGDPDVEYNPRRRR